MVFACRGIVAFRNTARRQAVAGNVNARLTSLVGGWGTTRVLEFPVWEGPPALTDVVYVSVRSSDKAAMDSFVSDVIAAFGGGINGPTTGSGLWRHDCLHDGSGACVPWVPVAGW